jgi:hypothetical protein
LLTDPLLTDPLLTDPLLTDSTQQFVLQQLLQHQHQFELQHQQELQRELNLLQQRTKRVTGDAGITGLNSCVLKALTPVVHTDPEWTLEDCAWKVCGCIGTVAGKYWRGEDERFANKTSTVKAQALIGEFVNECMCSLTKCCEERPWFNEADFTNPLLHAINGTFQGPAKRRFMCRLMSPVLRQTVDDALARFRAEARFQKTLWDAVVVSDLPSSCRKTIYKHLQNSFDRAHMNAPYGSMKATHTWHAWLQDFVKGWMHEFAVHALSILYTNANQDTEEQYAFLTTLFQYLIHPEQSCLPYEFIKSGIVPPENWGFVEDAALAIVGCARGRGNVAESPPKKLRLASCTP